MTSSDTPNPKRKKRWLRSLLVVLALLILGGGYWYLTEGWAWLYGTEAYIYGFPLIMMDLTKDAGTAVIHTWRDHSSCQSVFRHDALPGCFFPRCCQNWPRHAVCRCVGGSRQRATRALGAGHQRTLLRHRAVRYVEQRFYIVRQAQHGHRRGKFLDRWTWLAGHSSRWCETSLSLSDPMGMGKRSDASKWAK